MKALKRVLCALSALALVGLAVSCKNSDDDNDGVTIGAVTFSPESGEIAQGDKITLSTTTEEADIYYAVDTELTASNYLDLVDDGTAKRPGSGTAQITLNADDYDIDETYTFYAMAVDANGVCSLVTSTTFTVVAAPTAPAVTLSGTYSSTSEIFTTGATVSLASTYEKDTSLTPVIYYTTNGVKLTSSNYATAGKKYESAISLTGAVGDTVTVYAIAVVTLTSENETTVAIPSTVTEKSYKVVPQYQPLTGSVAEGTEGAGNYSLDGNIANFVKAVNGSTSEVTLTEPLTLSGYVTMIFGTDGGSKANQWVAVQDKDDAVQLYFGYGKSLDMSKFYLGQYVSVTASVGQWYNGVLEVKNLTPDDVNTDSANDTSVLYYNVLNGKTDFSGLETFKLSAIKCDPDSDSYSSTKDETTKAYKNPLSVVYTTESLAEGEIAKAFFGYVAPFDSGKTLELSVLYSKDEKFVTDAASALVNTVELPYTNVTGAFETSATVLLSDVITLTSVTGSDVTFTYALKGSADANFGADEAYTADDGISFTAADSALQVKVTASKDGYNSSTRIFTFEVQAINGDLLKFSALGLNNGDEIPEQALDFSTVSFAKNGSANAPKYYTDGAAGRFYYSNLMTVSTTTKTLKTIKFAWKSGYAADAENWTASTGTYSLASDGVAGTWEPAADSETFDVTFTNVTGTYRLAYIIIEYNDAEYLSPVTFSEEAGDLAKDTVVNLSTASESASIYYSTSEALTKDNYSTVGTQGTSVTIDAAKTIYAIAIDGTKYSKPTSVTYAIESTTPAALVSSIADGDEVVIWNTTSNGGFALTGTASGSKLAGTAVTPSENTFIASNAMLKLTVEAVTSGSDTFYRFKSGEQYLTATSTTTTSGEKTTTSYTLSFAALGDDTTTATWKLTAVEGLTGAYIVCTTATDPIYLEYYSGFSGYKSGTGYPYNMYFYKVGLDFSPVVSNPTISTSGQVASGTEVTITNTEARTGAKLYYSFGTALTADNYATVGAEATLTDNKASYAVTAAGTLYALTVIENGGTTYVSDVVSAEYTINTSSEESVTFSANGYDNGVEVPTVTLEGSTITWSKGTASNAPKYYTSGSAVRLYAKNTMTVAPVSGKTITKIVIGFGNSDGSNEITVDSGTYSEGTWTGSTTSAVTFTIGGTSGNRRFASVSITYAQ